MLQAWNHINKTKNICVPNKEKADMWSQMKGVIFNVIIKGFDDDNWPRTLEADAGGEVAEEVWHETRSRRAGKHAGEDTEVSENLFPGSLGDRGRLRAEENESEEEWKILSNGIEEQWQEIAAIAVW